MVTSEQNVKDLQSSLTTLLAQKAEVEEKISTIKATLQGVQLGIQYQKELEEKENGAST